MCSASTVLLSYIPRPLQIFYFYSEMVSNKVGKAGLGFAQVSLELEILLPQPLERLGTQALPGGFPTS